MPTGGFFVPISIERFPVGRLLVVLLAALALSAVAAAPSRAEITSTSECRDPQLSQQFLSLGDKNWYTLAPGQDANGFNGEGWTLSGGAQILSTTRSNGQAGNVLDLPSGSKAISPVMCVTKEFPKARSMVRNVVGSEGVFFYVSYAGTNTWNVPKNTGQFHGDHSNWTLSGAINLQPPSVEGWQLVRFTFIPGGTKSRFQVYDFWVDPFARR
jgi:hypothetical protein